MSWEHFFRDLRPHCRPTSVRTVGLHRCERPAQRLGPQARNYRAVIAFGDRISTSTAARQRADRRPHRHAARPRIAVET